MDLASAFAPHDLLEAVEDYELALSRLAWAQDCCCPIAGEQAQAIEWLCHECESSLGAMTAIAQQAATP